MSTPKAKFIQLSDNEVNLEISNLPLPNISSLTIRLDREAAFYVYRELHWILFREDLGL